ncbi:hypothetical protein [Nonomuraea typhae]|uniref:Uncharacterized protein n=1 Tax=Nonomuraea typhae TaxID=2603600 RepID=A0ABW7Z5S9_9ACTN
MTTPTWAYIAAYTAVAGCAARTTVPLAGRPVPRRLVLGSALLAGDGSPDRP